MSQSKATDAARALAQAQGEDAKAAADRLNNLQGTQVMEINGQQTTEWVWPRTNDGYMSRSRLGPDNIAVCIPLTKAELKNHIKRANYDYQYVNEADVPVARPPDAVGGDDDD
jgi:hypothetical protein